MPSHWLGFIPWLRGSVFLDLDSLLILDAWTSKLDWFWWSWRSPWYMVVNGSSFQRNSWNGATWSGLQSYIFLYSVFCKINLEIVMWSLSNWTLLSISRVLRPLRSFTHLVWFTKFSRNRDKHFLANGWKILHSSPGAKILLKFLVGLHFLQIWQTTSSWFTAPTMKMPWVLEFDCEDYHFVNTCISLFSPWKSVDQCWMFRCSKSRNLSLNCSTEARYLQFLASSLAVGHNRIAEQDMVEPFQSLPFWWF